MKHTYVKGLVLLEFINEKGEEKKVKFPFKKSFYDDICKLPESQIEYYLIHYYHENEIDRNQERKEMRNRDKFINIQSVESEEEEAIEYTNDKISQIADNSSDGDMVISRMMLKAVLNEFDVIDRQIIILSKGYDLSNREIAKKLTISEGTVRYRITKIEEKIIKFKNL